MNHKQEHYYYPTCAGYSQCRSGVRPSSYVARIPLWCVLAGLGGRHIVSNSFLAERLKMILPEVPIRDVRTKGRKT